MTHAVLERDTLMPRPPGGMGPGLLLALLVHGLLVVAIAFSVRWRASEPEGMEAELWASVPQVAAPPAPPPQPKPEPQPQAVAPPEPPPAVRPEPQPDPQIALEKEKARREEAEKRRRQEEAEKLAEKRRREEEAEKLAEKRRREEEAAEKKRKEEAVRLAEQRRKAEDEKRLAEQERQRQAELEKARQQRLERLMAQAGGTGDPSATGNAERSAGPSAGYAGRIKARIKPNIVFTDIPTGNPVAEVEVKLAPDGTILSQKLTKPSGMKEWDEAVVRAIDRTQVLPRDIDGRVPPSMVISFRPRD
ncbi:MAG TPA: cell envelope integrity protein TolA [Albitalea sp.]